MPPRHLVRFEHRQEMQIGKDMKGIVRFSSFGSRGKRGEGKQEGSGRGKQQERGGR